MSDSKKLWNLLNDVSDAYARGHSAGLAVSYDRVKALEEALRDCLGWHDYADDLHKPVEVRAAYMRARALLKDTNP